MLYFCYCEKMNPAEMQKICPKATALEVGTASGFILRYCSNRPVPGTGRAIITPGRRSDDIVFGVVFQVREDCCRKLLKLANDLNPEATIAEVKIRILDNAPMACSTICLESMNSLVPPSDDYRSQIIAAARLWNIDPNYIERCLAK